MSREMARPRPRPPPADLVLKKGSKTRSRRAGSRPGPWSRTRRATRPSCAAASIHSARCGCSRMASSALPMRLISTCSRRLGSHQAARGLSAVASCTVTCSLRMRWWYRNSALCTAVARRAACGWALDLRAKPLSGSMMAPICSARRAMMARLPLTASSWPRCMKATALPDRVRMAPSGCVSSWVMPVASWPSAAILPACTSSSCASRRVCSACSRSRTSLRRRALVSLRAWVRAVTFSSSSALSCSFCCTMRRRWLTSSISSSTKPALTPASRLSCAACWRTGRRSANIKRRQSVPSSVRPSTSMPRLAALRPWAPLAPRPAGSTPSTIWLSSSTRRSTCSGKRVMR